MMLFGYVSAEKSVKAPPPPVQNAVSVTIQSIPTCQQIMDKAQFAVDLNTQIQMVLSFSKSESVSNQKSGNSEFNGNNSQVCMIVQKSILGESTIKKSVVSFSEVNDQISALVNQSTTMEVSGIQKSICVNNITKIDYTALTVANESNQSENVG